MFISYCHNIICKCTHFYLKCLIYLLYCHICTYCTMILIQHVIILSSINCKYHCTLSALCYSTFYRSVNVKYVHYHQIEIYKYKSKSIYSYSKNMAPAKLIVLWTPEGEKCCNPSCRNFAQHIFMITLLYEHDLNRHAHCISMHQTIMHLITGNEI